MQIYIISSWKNQVTVESLTKILRENKHEVLSFVEKNYNLGFGHKKPENFEEWVETKDALEVFEYDTNAATKSDLVIYIGPSGMDAGVELGLAYSFNIPIIGFKAKGEQLGLMRKVVTYWIEHLDELFPLIEKIRENIIKNRDIVHLSLIKHYDIKRLKELPLDIIQTDIMNDTYAGSKLFEILEYAKVIRQNGHHLRQKVSEYASKLFEKVVKEEGINNEQR